MGWSRETRSNHPTLRHICWSGGERSLRQESGKVGEWVTRFFAETIELRWRIQRSAARIKSSDLPPTQQEIQTKELCSEEMKEFEDWQISQMRSTVIMRTSLFLLSFADSKRKTLIYPFFDSLTAPQAKIRH